jgi:5-methylcytosine-specific restriction endonuclease McrA
MLLAFGHRCMNCGAEGLTLELHHRNHDHTDDRPSNLTLLCKQCHGKAGIGLI